MKKKRLTIHIGWEKCASTSIQSWLEAANVKLPQHGLSALQAFGFPNASRLASYCADYVGSRNIHSWHRIETAGDLLEFRSAQEKALKDELVTSEANHWIVSTEHLSSQVSHVDELARLRQLFEPYFVDIEILAVVRPQADLAVSRYFEYLKAGNKGRFQLIPHSFFDFERSISRWESVFGSENVRVHEVADVSSHLKSGMDAFLFQSGLNEPLKDVSVSPANISLPPMGLEVLRQLNKHEIDTRRRKELVAKIRELPLRKDVSLVSGEDVARFSQAFISGNCALIDRHPCSCLEQLHTSRLPARADVLYADRSLMRQCGRFADKLMADG